MPAIIETDDQLSRLFYPQHLIAELTSRCNLRCKYCQKADEAWNQIPGRDQDIEDGALDRLFSSLKNNKFKTVQLSGIGEFTFRRDWVQTLNRFEETGVSVTMICNFAKQFTDEELDALLKTTNLMVSIDTVDADLLKSVRKSVSFQTISTNLVRLRMRAKKTGAQMPYLRLNAVLYAENLLGIEDLAWFAIDNRVDEMQYERMYPANNFGVPTEIKFVEPSRAREALKQMDFVAKILPENRVRPSFHGDLRQLLEERASL